MGIQIERSLPDKERKEKDRTSISEGVQKKQKVFDMLRRC